MQITLFKIIEMQRIKVCAFFMVEWGATGDTQVQSRRDGSLFLLVDNTHEMTAACHSSKVKHSTLLYASVPIKIV